MVTSSGRQVKARSGGVYGESLLSGQQALVEHGSSDVENGQSRTRSGRAAGSRRLVQRNNYTGTDGANDDSDSDLPSEEWNSDKDDVDDLDENLADAEDEDEDMSDGILDDEDAEIVQPTKVVTIKLGEHTSARLARSRHEKAQQQDYGSIGRNEPSIKHSKEERLKALPLQSISLTSATNDKADMDLAEDLAHSETTQVSFTSVLPALMRAKDDLFTNGTAHVESPSSKTKSMNGILGEDSPAVILEQPDASAQHGVSKLDESRFLQTPTPPRSDVLQSAPDSGNTSF